MYSLVVEPLSRPKKLQSCLPFLALSSPSFPSQGRILGGGAVWGASPSERFFLLQNPNRKSSVTHHISNRKRDNYLYQFIPFFPLFRREAPLRLTLSVCLSVFTPLAVLYLAIVYNVYNDSLLFLGNKPPSPPGNSQNFFFFFHSCSDHICYM